MGRCVSNIVIGISLLLAILWLVVMCIPSGWHTKSTLIWNFHLGLYRVQVDRSLGASIAHGAAAVIDLTASAIRKQKTTLLSRTLSHITEGENSLRYFRDMFCNVALMPVLDANCAPWDRILIGSWIMMIFTILTVLLLLLGAGFVYYYEYHSSRRKVRKWAVALLGGAGFCNLCGLGAYTGLSFQFGMWLAELMITSAQSTFAFVYVLALLMHLFTWTPILLACTCMLSTEREDIAEDMAWERKKLMYGYTDEGEQGFDENGNPIQQYDEYGNPLPPQIQYDQYGNPLPQCDEYGNPVSGSYHVSAYEQPSAYSQGPLQANLSPAYQQGSVEQHSQSSIPGQPMDQ